MAKIGLKKFHAVINGGNSALRTFRNMAKEMNTEYRKNAQLVRVTDSKGRVQEGFFYRLEVIFTDKLVFQVVLNPIIETSNMIMASEHKEYITDAQTIEPFNHKRFKHRVM